MKMYSRNYEIISNELLLYKEELADRIQILVLNKRDIGQRPPDLRKLEKNFQQLGQNVITVSGITGEGIDISERNCCRNSGTTEK